MLSRLVNTYHRYILKQPVMTLIVVTAVIAFFLLHATEFELDASADSLVLENDASLKYS